MVRAPGTVESSKGECSVQLCLQLGNAQGRHWTEQWWFMEIPSEKVLCTLLQDKPRSQVILEGMWMKFSDEDMKFYRLESHLIQTICWNVKLSPSLFSYISHSVCQVSIIDIRWGTTECQTLGLQRWTIQWFLFLRCLSWSSRSQSYSFHVFSNLNCEVRVCNLCASQLPGLSIVSIQFCWWNTIKSLHNLPNMATEMCNIVHYWYYDS